MNTLKLVGSAVLAGLLFFAAVVATKDAVQKVNQARELPLNDAASVVYVEVWNETEHEHGHGSGFYYGSNRFITAAHVVNGATKVQLKVTQPDGKFSEPKDVTVEWIDVDRDVAMLAAVGEIHLHAARVPCEPARLKTLVHSVGYPMSLGLVWTWGRVSSPVTTIENNASQIVDLTIAPGNSGGPIFDEDHNVIGISRAVPAIAGMFAQSPIALAVITPAPTVCDAIKADHTKKPDVQTP